MRFLVVGLGSMGKRRIRCLRALGEGEIDAYDPRADRRDFAAKEYGVRVHPSWADALATSRPDALVISVPPHKHHEYFLSAISEGIHFFVEASVVDDGLRDAISALRSTKIVGAPSATLSFHPGIKLIDAIVRSGELGKLSNVVQHVGQYLPDWHPYERVADFYVSRRETGGCREIVAFELSWFTRVFGWPTAVAAHCRKTIDITGAESIDDTYNILLDLPGHLAAITVDVVSRHAIRRLLVNGREKQLIWSWDEPRVRVYDPDRRAWDERSYDPGRAQEGYNHNIGEQMYVDELRAFIGAVKGEAPFPNAMADDLRVLELLYKIERSDARWAP